MIMMIRLRLQRALSCGALAPNEGQTASRITFAMIAGVTAMMDVAGRNEPARARDGKHYSRWITGKVECAPGTGGW